MQLMFLTKQHVALSSTNIVKDVGSSLKDDVDTRNRSFVLRSRILRSRGMSRPGGGHFTFFLVGMCRADFEK